MALSTQETISEGRGTAMLRGTQGEGPRHRSGSEKSSSCFLRLLHGLAPLARPTEAQRRVAGSPPAPRGFLPGEGLVMVHGWKFLGLLPERPGSGGGAPRQAGGPASPQRGLRWATARPAGKWGAARPRPPPSARTGPGPEAAPMRLRAVSAQPASAGPGPRPAPVPPRRRFRPRPRPQRAGRRRGPCWRRRGLLGTGKVRV